MAPNRVRSVWLQTAKDRSDTVKRLIEEALRSQDNTQSDVSRKPLELWPFLREDLNEKEVKKQVGPRKHTVEELTKRLSEFKYPYPQGTKKGSTFRDYLEKLGLLDLVLTPPFLTVIRRAWAWQMLAQLERDQYGKRTSQHGYPVAFHRELMLDIARHLKSLSEISRRHRVPYHWTADYRKSLLRELLRQASIYYPELLMWYKVPSRFRPKPRLSEERRQMMVRELLEKELWKQRIENKNLVYQLTALICSSQQCVKKHELCPTPEAVRTNHRARTIAF